MGKRSEQDLSENLSTEPGQLQVGRVGGVEYLVAKVRSTLRGAAVAEP